MRWFYILSLGSLGAIVPLLAARLEGAGLGGAALGLLFAVPPVARLVATPLWGWAADRWQVAGALLRAGCALSLVGVAILWRADTLLGAGVGLAAFAVGRAPMGPLVDAICFQSLGPRQDYGRVRLWGSVAFLLVVLSGGALHDLVGLDPLALGVALSVGVVALSFAFPVRGQGGPAPILPALRALLREPFLAPFLATAFLQALSLSVYDSFFSAHVRALGLPQFVTGGAVAVGVAAEVALMRFSGPLLARWGPFALLVAAAALGPLRWALTATVTSPAALVATQALHGVTFGAFWIAGVQTMASRAPKEVRASAQGLFSTVSYGFGALTGALLAGELHDAGGTPAIWWGLFVVSVAATGTAVWTMVRDRRAAEAARAA